MTNREAAAEVEEARRPAQLLPAVRRDIGKPLDREQALRASRQLRADVHVEPGDVEPRGERVSDRRERVVGDEPELRFRMGGPDRTVRLRVDARSDADEHGSNACRFRPRNLVERIDDHDCPGLGRRLELFVGLVVAMEQDPLALHACAQRELELTARGDVGPQTLPGEEPEQRDVGERLRPVHDERFGIHSRIRARPGENRLPAVHEERRAELLREGRRTDSAHHELAVLDGCRVGEELDQPVSRSTTPEPFRRRPDRCSGRPRSGTRHPRRPLPGSASCPCGREPRPTA